MPSKHNNNNIRFFNCQKKIPCNLVPVILQADVCVADITQNCCRHYIFGNTLFIIHFLAFHNNMSGTKCLQQNSLLHFRSNDILSLLHLFESTNFDLSSTDVENATNQFTNIMTEAAKRSVKLSSQKKSKRKPITKKWFDYDCKTLRSSLKKLSNQKKPAILWIPNSEKNIMFKIEPLKNLSNKKKQQQFVDSKINELISNENDRTFWDTLKSMNENGLSYNNITKTRPINFTIILKRYTQHLIPIHYRHFKYTC